MRTAYATFQSTILSKVTSEPVRFIVSAHEDGSTLADVLAQRGYDIKGHYAAMHPELGLYVDAVNGYRAPKGYFFSFLSGGDWIKVSVDRYIVSAGEHVEIALERIRS